MKNNNLKEWLITISVVLVITVIPISFNLYDRSIERETFYEYINEDFETCVTRAKRDSRDDFWCKEIKDSSKLAYRSATNSSEHSVLFIVLFVGLVVMMLSVRSLRMKMEVSK